MSKLLDFFKWNLYFFLFNQKNINLKVFWKFLRFAIGTKNASENSNLLTKNSKSVRNELNLNLFTNYSIWQVNWKRGSITSALQPFLLQKFSSTPHLWYELKTISPTRKPTVFDIYLPHVLKFIYTFRKL